jgi:Phage portal protein, SPP1 Gp6-like
VSTVEQAPPPQHERTPLIWLKLLEGRLLALRQPLETYDAYYRGEHPLQFATSKFREAFGRLFEAFGDNWCQIVVDASVERLKVDGFRAGGDTSDEAWAIWQRNALDVESTIAHTEAGKSGHVYLLVDPNGEDGPRITVETPLQVIVASDPGDRRRRVAALKRWNDDSGRGYATVYLPDYVLKYESEKPLRESTEVEWVPRRDAEAIVPNTLGVVPVIRMENKPGLHGRPGTSDLEPAIPLQNAVNKLCTDLLVASEYGAFPQRVISGIEVPRDADTGKPLPLSSGEQLQAALNRVWRLENPDSKVWNLSAADLSNYVKAVEMFIQHLAAQTRTPPHYLLGQVVNASGNALKVAEAGLVSKCEGKILYFSDAWEEAMALALGVAQADCEALWKSPERTSATELSDAAVKKQSVGVPKQVLWRELGYSPAQIAEMLAMEPEPDTEPAPPAGAAPAAAPAPASAPPEFQ